MRRKSPCHPTAVLFLATFLAQVSGCTLVGYGIGAAADAGSKRTVAARDLPATALEPGQRVTVQLKDGSKATGEYRGVDLLPLGVYTVRYEAARGALAPDLPLPALGDTIALALVSGGEATGEFLGFDHGRVLISGANVPRGVGLTEARRLTTSGSTERIGPIINAIAAGGVPSRSAVTIEVQRSYRERPGEQQFSLDRIDHITWKSHSGRTAGLIVGGVIDAAAIAGLVYCASKDSSALSPC